MKIIIIPVLFLASLCLQGDLLHAQTIRYVKPANNGAANGSSWANASYDLQLMIDNSIAGDMIFVAAGLYTRDNAAYFIMKEGVKIYGGFAGTETQLSQRNWLTNVTTLRHRSNYSAIFNDKNGLTSAAVLDGFTITRTSTPPSILEGAGMYNNLSSPTVANCTFLNLTALSKGAAVYNVDCAPVFTNCHFTANTSRHGAVMYNLGASPAITDCNFSDNRAVDAGTWTNGRGGAMYNVRSASNVSAPIITRCTFINNEAEICGGAIFNGEMSQAVINNCLFLDNRGAGSGLYNELSSPVVTGCTFSGSSGGSQYTPVGPSTILNVGSTPVFRNCIIWGNVAGIKDSSAAAAIFEFNIIQGGYTGTGNLDTDPYFNSNYELQICSPAIDAGSNAAVPGGTTTDLAGRQRIRGAVVDMGAYEFRPPLPGSGNILYVNSNVNTVSSDASGSSWANAIQFLSDALLYAKKNESNWTATDPLKIFVAVGSHTPRQRPDILCSQDINDRNNSFPMIGNVQLFGGFDPANGIDDLSDSRIMGAAGSILNGDIGGTGNNADNSYHVVTATGLANAMLDGFTISGGQADGSGNLDHGGGIFINNASPVINNCTISTNQSAQYGGGIYILGTSSPSITGCILSNNTAGFFGAGLFNANPATSAIRRCTFSGNSTHFGGAMYNDGIITVTGCGFYNNTANSYGGAVYQAWNNASYINCVFSGNSTINGGGGGGGLFNNSSAVTITNCTFSANTADLGAIQNYGTGTASIRNSLVWGNNTTVYNEPTAGATVQHSLVQGGHAGTGNINADPLFINASSPLGADGVSGTADDGLRLQPCSPAINVGNNAYVDAGNTTDAAGTTRMQTGTVDMGAYEANTVVNANATALTTSNTVVNAWQFPNSTTRYGPDCNTLMATVTGNGSATALGGNTTVKVWIETIQSGNFVKRHYEITPLDMSPVTATGLVTLYFTQAEFDAFNALNMVRLPQGPADAMGKANLLVEKRAGISGNNSGLPASYSGAITTINPNDADIVWNAIALRWEVSITVSGFSGFFIKTNASSLPLRLVQFTAEEKNCIVKLQWITADETGVSHFEVQQSIDGASFESFKTIPARNTIGENKYATTVPVENNKMFYRLKMVDVDGTVTYSQVSVVNANCGGKLQLFPNPSSEKIYMRNAVVGSNYRVFDNKGRVVVAGNISKPLQEIYIGGLKTGMYYVVVDGRNMKFVKSGVR